MKYHTYLSADQGLNTPSTNPCELLDIMNAADYVTVSWNRFENHDKVMLIGSSDGATADRSKLKVTLHHNLLKDLGQRTPRDRFVQVHVYNNYYKINYPGAFVYAWG